MEIKIMEKLILAVLLGLFSNVVWGNAQFKKVIWCDYDYDIFDYCSKSNINKYKKALRTQKPNFDQKYILINVGTKKEYIFIAIDTETGISYPLTDKIIGFKNERGGLTGVPPIINYSIDNKDLCIKGSIDAYRRSEDNIQVCFSIRNLTTGTEFFINGSSEKYTP